MLKLNLPSPLQEIEEELLRKHKVRLFMKRDDLIHEVVSGNKWRKLKFNLQEAKRLGRTTLLSFGGAYSNHIHALAKAGQEEGFRTIGVIRGDELVELNPTLTFAGECGMELSFISREEYRKKTEAEFIENLKNKFGEFYLIPEGGGNSLGVKGCAEIVAELTMPFDYLCTACGTGTTLTGLVSALSGEARAIGFPVLKGGDFLKEEINGLLSEVKCTNSNWELATEYHFGGYGKWNDALLLFMDEFNKTHGIQLDQVYTGKLMYGIYDKIEKGFFKEGSIVMALHTGGLQGLEGVRK